MKTSSPEDEFNLNPKQSLTVNAHQIKIKPPTHTSSAKTVKTSWSNQGQQVVFRKALKTRWSNPLQQVVFRQIKSQAKQAVTLHSFAVAHARRPSHPSPVPGLLLASERAQRERAHTTYPSPISTFSPSLHVAQSSMPKQPRPPSNHSIQVSIAFIQVQACQAPSPRNKSTTLPKASLRASAYSARRRERA